MSLKNEGLVERFYEFGSLRLDTKQRMVSRDGQRVRLTPRAFDILLVLVKAHGEAVAKNDLMLQVWPDTVVEEGNLNYHISKIRGAIGDGVIETLPRLGYRIVAPPKPEGTGIHVVPPVTNVVEAAEPCVLYRVAKQRACTMNIPGIGG